MHLPTLENSLNGNSWAKGFIERLSRITHSQSTLQNIYLHSKKNGYLQQKELKELNDIAEELLQNNPVELPEEGRFLMKMEGPNYQMEHIMR